LLAALGSVLGVALATWIAARVLARALTTGTKVGIAGLDGIAAPLSLLVATGVAAFGIARPSQAETPPLIGLALGVLGIVGGFWLAQRCLDVAWKTAKERARVQGRHVDDALLVGRSLGRVVLIVCAAAVAVRLGATEQLYFVLTALGAALAFAARDPIRNAIAFVSMVTDPPFHVGDRVRLVDLRGGEDVTGEVVALSLTGTTIETDRRTHVVLSNVTVGQLRVENLSAADRRRLELALPVADDLSAEELRDTCDAVEADLRGSPHVSSFRPPRVWISLVDQGLHLKASA
jgi:MscS family membrane protein